MEDTDLVEVVQEVVDGFADDFKAFTSLDVSNAVKESGNAFRHREVAKAVRALFAQGYMSDNHEYVRVIIGVNLPNGRTAQAWLYHHETVDPADYDARSQVSVRPPVDSQVSEEERVASPQPRSLSDVVNQSQEGDDEEPTNDVPQRLRSLSEVVSSTRRSIFDVANRGLKTLICRRGPKDNPEVREVNEETLREVRESGVTNPCQEMPRIIHSERENPQVHEILQDICEQAPAIDSQELPSTVHDATTRRQKADCRLEIPPSWVDSLGWEAGDKVAAVDEADESRIVLKHVDNVEDNENAVGLMTVLSDGRLRLTKTALDRSSLNHGPNQELSLALLDNVIVVY